MWEWATKPTESKEIYIYSPFSFSWWRYDDQADGDADGDGDVDQADGDADGRPARGVDSKEENSNGEHQEANAHN